MRKKNPLDLPCSHGVVFVALLGSTGSDRFEEISKIAAHHFTRYITQNAAARPGATLSPPLVNLKGSPRKENKTT